MVTAKILLNQINKVRILFCKENGFEPTHIKINKEYVKMLEVKYTPLVLVYNQCPSIKTLFGMEIEEIEEKYWHIYKKGC